MVDLFSTNVLAAVVQDLIRPSSFLLDRYFPSVQTEASEEIHFDVDKSRRRITPFVSPLVAGQVVASRGFHTSTFKPAYAKDKRVFDPSRPLKRFLGERIGGSLSPEDRIRAILGWELVDQLNMLTRRQEVMASEALRTGKVTVVGDQYPSTVVDFLRDASLTVTLTSTARWGQSAAAILDNLEDWSQIVLQLTGAQVTDVIMTVDVWKIFKADATIKDVISRQRKLGEAPTLSEDAQIKEGGVYMGSIEGFNIYVYAGWYVDPADDTEKAIMPAGTVIMTSPSLDGVRAFGAIRDEEAGYQALPYFTKSWVEKDPAVRMLLMQSAPLTVPYRVNASFKAAVL